MKLKVYNTQYDRRDAYFFPVEEFHTYEGREVQVKWAGAHELALETNDSVGLRIIQRRLIREIDGHAYSYTQGVHAVKDRVMAVKGSRGQTYTVTLGSSNNCTCPGFTYRGSCKHVKELV